MAEQQSLEWYEYDKAEEQVAALQSKMDEAIKDLEQFDLSPFSRSAIMNEIERYSMYKSDILEMLNEPQDTEPVQVADGADCD